MKYIGFGIETFQNRGFAQKIAYKGVILSAKYGFIDPSIGIPENYDVSLNDHATNPIGRRELKIQLKENGLGKYDVVIALDGKNHIEVVKEVFRDVLKWSSPPKVCL